VGLHIWNPGAPPRWRSEITNTWVAMVFSFIVSQAAAAVR
jgi:hypothetical protein